MNKAFLLLMY